MQADELNLMKILDINHDEGLIHIGTDRVILIDTQSLGMLRKELIETIGQEAAKGILTRFGYSQGWKTAHSLKKSIKWRGEMEWRRGGGRLHQISGVVKVVPVKNSSHMFEAHWYNSYEAEEHAHAFGNSLEPVCWSLTGFASGYLSAVMKEKIFFIEESCSGQGGKFCHVIGKPFKEWGNQARSIEHYYSHQTLCESLGRVATKLRQTEKKLKEKYAQLKNSDLLDGDLLVRSPEMIKLVESAKHIAPVETTVLILGESGTGKELLARLIHNLSSRKKGAFIGINCGAFPENLLESELFGYTKGAFTGAETDRAGIFEQAQGGTLFLDEVGEMSLKTQVRLLRALQEKEIQKLGDTKTTKIDVRIIAATNRNLSKLIEENLFRSDLYYRLRVVEFNIPSLCNRKEEILPLAKFFQGKFCKKYNKPLLDFSPEFSDFLTNYKWPGNVRELQNVIESVVVLTREGKITIQNLPSYFINVEKSVETKNQIKVRKIEDEILRAVSNALEIMKGSTQAEIAAALGITPATLWRKRKEINKI